MYLHAKVRESVLGEYEVRYMTDAVRDKRFKYVDDAIIHLQKQEFRLVSVTHNDLGHSKEFWFVKD